MNKKQLHLIHDIRKRLRNRDKICINKNCKRPAIKSHLLQQNGILNFIATNSDIIQLNSDANFEETIYRFQKRSIGKAEVLTFKMLCSECDNKMFELVEKTTPDFTDYKTQLLFSYRAFLREYSAIIFGLDFYSECIACRDLDPELKARLAPMKRAYQLVLYSYKFFSDLFEKDLNQKYSALYSPFLGPKKHFKFHCFEIGKIEVAASAILSYEHDIMMKKDEYNLKKPLPKKIASRTKPVFINLIPRENSSVIIIGYPKGVSRIERLPVDKIDQFSTDELLKIVSDILVKRINNWCTSLSFFEAMKQTGKDKKILDLKHQYFIHPTSEMTLIKEMEIDFNLFQGS